VCEMMSAVYVCNLGRAFSETAARNSDLPAIRIEPGNDVSYARLDALSDRLARWLIERGIGPAAVVALQNGKTLYGYASMLACLKVGAAYTNLDVQNPIERLSRILSTCRPTLVLCDSPPAPSITAACTLTSTPAVNLLEYRAELEAAGAPLPFPSVTGSDVAYLMFTSGSTGVPKGVAISHSSVLNFIAWSRSTFGIGPGDIVANVNPIYFDNSVFDCYSALFTGACLAPIRGTELAKAQSTVRAVDEAGCTVWFSVPTFLIYLMTMKSLRQDTFRKIHTIIFGGEGYPKSELAKLFHLYGGRSRFYNVYGPTECTCICSAYPISAADLADGQGLPPLGRIADNFSYLVLDGDKPVQQGETGELCLLGPQLGLAYYNDPERTQAAFVENPQARALPQRMYRTGDLVREVNGLLHFVGRKDNQIKHMGYRIELEEIEAMINRLDYVVQSAVVYKRIRPGFGHIIAYVATRDDLAEERLRTDLVSSLPNYMIPNRIVISRELPRNANGKVDRAHLNAL
jgi:D-alanine--poly(phosphoribitol) ligase subunit 1